MKVLELKHGLNVRCYSVTIISHLAGCGHFEFELWNVWLSTPLSGPQSDMCDLSSRTFQTAPVPK